VAHDFRLWVFIVVAAATAALTALAIWLVTARARHSRRLGTSPA
jgi:hypothetical protein